MTIELDVQLETAVPPHTEDALEQAAYAVLSDQNISSAMLTVLLTDDENMRRLNHRFRKQDKSTDVLSFPFGDVQIPMEDDIAYLGDIAISVPYAQRQAARMGHDTTAELQLLLIHGILHLLGYDHNDIKGKQQMWAVQSRVLGHLGLENVEPTEG